MLDLEILRESIKQCGILEMSEKLTIALVGIVGVVIGGMVGAVAHYYFQKPLMEQQEVITETSKAYADYITGVAALDLEEKYTEIAKAKARIVIYGNTEVIKKMAEFHRMHSTTVTDEGLESFLEIIGSMREDLYGESEVDIEDIRGTIVGK